MTPTRPADHVLACPAAPSAPVSFGEAFRFWLKLGFIRFGGPAGQIAILHSEPVEGRRWISEQRLLHALNCCMLLPSPEAEQRGCLLIAFGGPGEIVERERVHSAGGLAVLLGLIGQGFDGGTGLQTLIERAIERVQPERWASADLLIVSDGEFGCSAATLAQLGRGARAARPARAGRAGGQPRDDGFDGGGRQHLLGARLAPPRPGPAARGRLLAGAQQKPDGAVFSERAVGPCGPASAAVRHGPRR